MIRKQFLVILLSLSSVLYAQDDSLVTYNLRRFYSWYIQQSAGTNPSPFEAKIVKNDKGFAEMQLKEYADLIRGTKFFTEGFIENELARLQPCANEVAKYKFNKWQKLELGEHPVQCVVEYDYWLQAQDVPDRIKIKKVERKGFAATVWFGFETGAGAEANEWEIGGIARVEVHNSQWLVGSIEFKK